MRHILLILLFSHISLFSLGQSACLLENIEYYINNAEHELLNANTDSSKSSISFKLYNLWQLNNNTEKANKYAQQGLQFSKGNSLLNAVYLLNKAKILAATKETSTALLTLLKADSLLSNLSHKKGNELKAEVWLLYASLQQLKEDEKAAMLTLLTKALPYSISSGNHLLQGNTYKSISLILMNARLRKKAALYFSKAIQAINYNSEKDILKLDCLVETYIHTAENLTYLHQFDSAFIYISKAKEILKLYPQSNLHLFFFYTEGVYNSEIKETEKALHSFNQGLTFRTTGDASIIHALSRLQIGKVHMLVRSKYYSEAITTIQSILKKSFVFAHDKQFYYKWLFMSYTSIGNHKKSVYWAEKYIHLTDSMHPTNIQSEITELESKYQNYENEKKIVSLNAEKEKEVLVAKNYKLTVFLLSITAVLFLVLFLIAFLYYKSYKKLVEQKEIIHLKQLSDLQKQAKLKLTEALLQGEENERKRIAADLHDGIGGILAGVKLNLSSITLTNASADTIKEWSNIQAQLENAIAEIRRIAKNMMPEVLLSMGLQEALKDICESALSGKVKLNLQALNIDPHLPKEIQITIYRIVQELLTNVIRHASAEYILVQCSQDINTFFITVEDNGVGFDLNKTTAKGLGLINIKNRVEYLQGNMEIKSSPGNGTIINIELNIKST